MKETQPDFPAISAEVPCSCTILPTDPTHISTRLSSHLPATHCSLAASCCRPARSEAKTNCAEGCRIGHSEAGCAEANCCGAVQCGDKLLNRISDADDCDMRHSEGRNCGSVCAEVNCCVRCSAKSHNKISGTDASICGTKWHTKKISDSKGCCAACPKTQRCLESSIDCRGTNPSGTNQLNTARGTKSSNNKLSGMKHCRDTCTCFETACHDAVWSNARCANCSENCSANCSATFCGTGCFCGSHIGTHIDSNKCSLNTFYDDAHKCVENAFQPDSIYWNHDRNLANHDHSLMGRDHNHSNQDPNNLYQDNKHCNRNQDYLTDHDFKNDSSEEHKSELKNASAQQYFQTLEPPDHAIQHTCTNKKTEVKANPLLQNAASNNAHLRTHNRTINQTPNCTPDAESNCCERRNMDNTVRDHANSCAQLRSYDNLTSKITTPLCKISNQNLVQNSRRCTLDCTQNAAQSKVYESAQIGAPICAHNGNNHPTIKNITPELDTPQDSKLNIPSTTAQDILNKSAQICAHFCAHNGTNDSTTKNTSPELDTPDSCKLHSPTTTLQDSSYKSAQTCAPNCTHVDAYDTTEKTALFTRPTTNPGFEPTSPIKAVSIHRKDSHCVGDKTIWSGEAEGKGEGVKCNEEIRSSSYLERVCEEIVKTERNYVKDIEDVCKGYLKYLEPTSSKEDMLLLFGNVEDLVKINKQFLLHLEMKPFDAEHIATCFLFHSQHLLVGYTHYCTNYFKSIETLRKWLANDHLRNELLNCQKKLQHCLSIGSYLLKPVQRILKYHLMLENLSKCYHVTESAYDVIKLAAARMMAVARAINEASERGEAILRMVAMGTKVVDKNGVKLERSGRLLLVSKLKVGVKTLRHRHLLLYEKSLVIAKQNDDNSSVLQLKREIKCDNLMLVETISKSALMFSVYMFDCPSVQYFIQTNTLKEKDLWCGKIKKLIVEVFANNNNIPQNARRLITMLTDNIHGYPTHATSLKTSFSCDSLGDWGSRGSTDSNPKNITPHESITDCSDHVNGVDNLPNSKSGENAAEWEKCFVCNRSDEKPDEYNGLSENCGEFDIHKNNNFHSKNNSRDGEPKKNEKNIFGKSQSSDPQLRPITTDVLADILSRRLGGSFQQPRGCEPRKNCVFSDRHYRQTSGNGSGKSALSAALSIGELKLRLARFCTPPRDLEVVCLSHYPEIGLEAEKLATISRYATPFREFDYLPRAEGPADDWGSTTDFNWVDLDPLKVSGIGCGVSADLGGYSGLKTRSKSITENLTVRCGPDMRSVDPCKDAGLNKKLPKRSESFHGSPMHRTRLLPPLKPVKSPVDVLKNAFVVWQDKLRTRSRSQDARGGNRVAAAKGAVVTRRDVSQNKRIINRFSDKNQRLKLGSGDINDYIDCDLGVTSRDSVRWRSKRDTLGLDGKKIEELLEPYPELDPSRGRKLKIAFEDADGDVSGVRRTCRVDAKEGFVLGEKKPKLWNFRDEMKAKPETPCDKFARSTDSPANSDNIKQQLRNKFSLMLKKRFAKSSSGECFNAVEVPGLLFIDDSETDS